MDIIHKVTVTYSSLEDRLRFVVQTEKSESYLFWLTARLATAVVAAVVKTLDDVPLAFPKEQQKYFQQWEQYSALQQMKITPAVDPLLPREDLIQSIDVSVRAENYTLTFHGVNHTEARLSLNSTQMRQWLQIVYAQFLKAKWSLTIWPAWFDRSQVAAKCHQSTVLH